MLREVERICVSATAYSFRDSATRKPVRLTRLVYRGFSNSTDATGRGSCGQRRKWRVPLGRDKGLVGEEQEGKLEAIFFLPQIERSFTALRYAFDRIPHLRVEIDGQIRGILKTFGLVVGSGNKGAFAQRARMLAQDHPVLSALIDKLIEVREVAVAKVAALDKEIVVLSATT